MPRNNIMVENTMEISNPFLNSNVPITMPSSPVVKSRMIASCILTKVRINAEEISTVSPRGI